ncbi:MAG: hypothetical protein K2W82_15525 [Candidatus Obscuribacterales bacterium]|nr:hypothetical protein [Candidatus Obscuribacterales bacterium]
MATLFLLIGLCFLSYFFGSMAALVFTSGPAAVFILGAILSLVAAYVAHQISDGKLTFAILIAAIAFIPTIRILRNSSNDGKELKAIATEVVQFGLEHFTALDTDSSGTISENEMTHGASNRQFTSVQRRLVEHMYAHRSRIGHVTDVDYDWNPATETIDSTTYYGISKLDLQSYQHRLAERYKRW